MPSFRSALKRAWRLVLYLAAAIGFLHVLITATPVLRLWTGLLSTNWGNGKGDTLVVLGSDLTSPNVMGISSYWRSFYATLVWREGHFRRVVVSGKDAAPLMKDFLVCHGIPADAIVVENRSVSTRDNALNVAALLAGDSAARGDGVVLLTSDFHMRRALAALKKAGVDASPLPFPDALKRINSYSDRWSVFCILTVETAKTLVYRWRGWT
jgi:uncharacterized SAM-binding protein YcdF (DUF218 family)